MADNKPQGLIAEVRQFLNDLARDLPHVFSGPAAARKRLRRRVPFRGEDLALSVIEDPSAGRSEIVHSADGLTLRRGVDGQPPQSALREWYAQRAREIFTERAAHWAARLGVRYRKLSIRDQRTVWGSCTKAGDLSFNWRVVMAPASVLDYLVIHELAHLMEMNHSKRFWTHVARHCPDWKAQRLWLRDHSRRLKAAVRRAA